jgi:hypothetical protein
MLRQLAKPPSDFGAWKAKHRPNVEFGPAVCVVAVSLG